MTPALDLIRSRISTNEFDSTKSLSQQEIRELVEYATQAPSSTNFHHWCFISITEQEDKERLKQVAYGQQKVADPPSPSSSRAICAFTRSRGRPSTGR